MDTDPFDGCQGSKWVTDPCPNSPGEARFPPVRGCCEIQSQHGVPKMSVPHSQPPKKCVKKAFAPLLRGRESDFTAMATDGDYHGRKYLRMETKWQKNCGVYLETQ